MKINETRPAEKLLVRTPLEVQTFIQNPWPFLNRVQAGGMTLALLERQLKKRCSE